MSDNGGNTQKPLTLSLNRKIEAGTVKQALSRGRSKTVTVEVKKSRNMRGEDKNLSPEERMMKESGLSRAEMDSRMKAISNAQERNEAKAEEALKKEAEAKNEALKAPQANNNTNTSANTNTAPTTESAPVSTRKIFGKTSIDVKMTATEVNESYVSATPQQKREQQQQAIAQIQAQAQKAKGIEKKPDSDKPTSLIDDADSGRGGKALKKSKTDLSTTQWSPKGKASLAKMLQLDTDERMRSFASVKRQRNKSKRQQHGQVLETGQQKVREVIIPEFITVQELAIRMAVRVQDVIKELMKLGMMQRATDEIDADTAELIVGEFKQISKRVLDSDVENILKEAEASEDDLKPRPPIVTVMGHVDHGKTSLLDAIRNANIVDGEAGGITQHIGAYQVVVRDERKVTFIDTPGHAAFTAMRARGANITDIVILVVAADDGIMPQTIEAINHAKAAKVPIIVAINKIDKPDANPQRVKNELLTYELVPEDMGGDVQVVEISAKQRTNLEGLLDSVLIQADMLDLKASEKQRPVGTVVESRMDKGRGVIATLLVQRGTLSKGDLIVAGTAFGRIKTIFSDKGVQLDSAVPSTPIEILGFDEAPAAGETFALVTSEKEARDVTEYRKKAIQVQKNKANSKSNSMENLFQQAQGGGKELNIIIKGDVQGSIEAIIGTIAKFENPEVKVKVIHSAVGGISESDVQLASAVKAMIVGFNVRSETNARAMAEREGTDIRYYSIIYNLVDDIRGLISGMLEPTIRENIIGNAEIQEIFKMSKYGKVAGCIVRDGVVKRGLGVRLLRDNIVIHEGKLKTLKRFKDDVNEVKQGLECGMAFENYEDIKPGDYIECFEIIKEARTLEV
jgi:translation initiation factor IF-2